MQKKQKRPNQKSTKLVFEKVNKADTPLAILIKKQRTKSTKFEMKMERSQ